MGTRTCKRCGQSFSQKTIHEGELVILSRTTCLDCKPYNPRARVPMGEKRKTYPKRVII